MNPIVENTNFFNEMALESRKCSETHEKFEALLKPWLDAMTTMEYVHVYEAREERELLQNKVVGDAKSIKRVREDLNNLFDQVSELNENTDNSSKIIKLRFAIALHKSVILEFEERIITSIDNFSSRRIGDLYKRIIPGVSIDELKTKTEKLSMLWDSAKIEAITKDYYTKKEYDALALVRAKKVEIHKELVKCKTELLQLEESSRTNNSSEENEVSRIQQDLARFHRDYDVDAFEVQVRDQSGTEKKVMSYSEMFFRLLLPPPQSEIDELKILNQTLDDLAVSLERTEIKIQDCRLKDDSAINLLNLIHKRDQLKLEINQCKDKIRTKMKDVDREKKVK